MWMIMAAELVRLIQWFNSAVICFKEVSSFYEHFYLSGPVRPLVLRNKERQRKEASRFVKCLVSNSSFRIWDRQLLRSLSVALGCSLAKLATPHSNPDKWFRFSSLLLKIQPSNQQAKWFLPSNVWCTPTMARRPAIGPAKTRNDCPAAFNRWTHNCRRSSAKAFSTTWKLS